MSTSLIIVAAGSGERLCESRPKAYVDLCGAPLIRRTVQRFIDSDLIDGEFIIVINPKHRHLAKDALAGLEREIKNVPGGDTRAASVANGLSALSHNPKRVLIHDAARPFCSDSVIGDVISALETHDGAAPALMLTDAIKSINTDQIEDVDRTPLRRVQTPQGFKYTKIINAFKTASNIEAAHDDISIAAKAGLTLKLTQGSEDNFKITFPKDLKNAEAKIMDSYITVTGSGYDVHRTEPGDHVWLCGVNVPAEFSLLGHSDADIGLHALTDAVLGAIAQGDIGDHFPPSDPKWKDAASDQFLRHALKLANDQDATLVHLDITLICEAPKIKPHRQAMRERLADITGLALSRISVKATTTEKLGFTGRGEGLAAEAIVTMQVKT